HVQHQAQTRRQRLEEPDVRGRGGELDMAHPFPSYFCERNFNSALFADDAAVLQALVLAAKALVVLDRPEDLGAEKPVSLRLERPVVDGLGLLYLAVGPGADLLGRSEPDLDRIELLVLLDLLEELK